MLRNTLIVCISLFALNLFGQSGFLRHYSINEGLPGSETYMAFEDNKGYVWVASDMGVCRFDGYNFNTYTIADGLTDNTIFSFYQDPKDRIWFFTFSGKLCYFQNDTIYGKNLAVNDTLHTLLQGGLFTSLYADEHDTLFVAAATGLLKVIPAMQNGRRVWNRVEVISRKHTFLVNGGYVTVEPLTPLKGKSPAQQPENGNTLLTKHIGGIESSPVNLPYPVRSLIALRQTSNGSLLLFYSDLAVLVDATGNVTVAKNIKLGITAQSENDSMVWIGQKRKGMHLFSLNDLEHPLRSILNPLAVTSLLKDHENGYWFTTLEDGLFYMPSSKFSYFPPVGDSLMYNETTIRCPDKNLTWVITPFHIFESRDRSPFTEILTNLRKQLPSFGLLYFWNAFTHSDGTVWLSTSSGIAIIDKNTGKLNRYIDLYARNKNIESDSRYLLEDRNKDVWSLNLSNLTKIDHQTKQVVKTVPIPSRAARFIEDEQGRLLITTIDGVYTYHDDSLYYPGTENKIFKTRFGDIKQSKGRLITVSKGYGLTIIAGDSIYTVTTANGLSSNMCRSMFVDSTGVIWVATNKGLNAVSLTYNPFKASVRQYSVADGLLTNDLDQVIKGDNIIWLRSKKGITAFDPIVATSNAVPPPVYITRIKINGAMRVPDSIAAIAYRGNNISIDFVGLTYKNAGKQGYNYKLEGLDTAWTYTTGTSVQFTRLPPGNYQFAVIGINNSGVQSAKPAVYRFTINAPFYLMGWFYILVALLFIALVVLISMLWVRRIRKREELKTEINRKIANHELQALRAQMNPHFIFNCLNAIQDFILTNEPEEARHYLSSFSKLIRKTLDNSRRQNISLSEEIEFLHLYLELERMRFVNKFSYSINLQEGLSRQNIEIPSMMVQPFIENAIRHGKIGSMETAGELKIDFEVKGGELVCIIDDNGVGIHQSQKLKSHRPGPNEAHAMDIMNDRMRSINDLHRSGIRYTITDKSDILPGQTGTRAEIYIPLN